MSKKIKSNLGRSLIKDRFGHRKKRTLDNNTMLHTTEVQDGYDWGRLNLQSVTEESSFQEFLRTAELAGTEFQAEKLNISFVNPKSHVGLLTTAERKEVEQIHEDKKDLLKIPRRPAWTVTTTAEDLKELENSSFLEWRRGLATLQENDGLLLTPYEKNLEFWRQLWRVVEKSDVIVQIVDGRNPMLFRSEDLEKYVKEVNENKLNMILINKADFLTTDQRIKWAEYFDNEKMRVVFFSAVLAAEELKTVIEASDENDSSESESDNSIEDKDEGKKQDVTKIKNIGKALLEDVNKLEKVVETVENMLEKQKITEDNSIKQNSLNCPDILSREELIEFFQNVHRGTKVQEGLTTIGLVGYPNVGKSSTINSLLTEKKVSVSATPGKTKHFQTIFLNDNLLLCDCPGLVMPSYILTKADMILNGILPIDQMRDHVPPVNLLCTLIPRHILEDNYGIIIAKPLEGEDPDRPPFSEEFLLAYGYNRGFMTANGQPDQARSARYVLKDYVNGKLLFCYAPPGVEQKQYHTYPDRVKDVINEKTLPPQQQRAMRMARNCEDVDEKFFKQSNSIAYIKGKADFPNVRQPSSTYGGQSQGASLAGSTNSLNGVLYGDKPWRHKKKEKREKLRRKFAHLDQH